MKNMNFDYDFIDFVPNGPLNNMPALDSDNGLAPTRRQAITWTNGKFKDAYMRHPASMSKLISIQNVMKRVMQNMQSVAYLHEIS